MLRLICTKFDFGWGSAEKLTAIPQTPQLDLKGPTSKGMGGSDKGGERKGKGGEGQGMGEWERRGAEEGEGKEGEGRTGGEGIGKFASS